MASQLNKIWGGYPDGLASPAATVFFGEVGAKSFGIGRAGLGSIGPVTQLGLGACLAGGNLGKTGAWLGVSGGVGMVASEWYGYRVGNVGFSGVVRQISQLRGAPICELGEAGGALGLAEGGRPPFGARLLPRTLPLAGFRISIRPLFADRAARAVEGAGRGMFRAADTGRGGGVSRSAPNRASGKGSGVAARLGIPTRGVLGGAGVSRAERGRLSGLCAAGKRGAGHG